MRDGQTQWQKVRSWLNQNAANVVLPGLTLLATAVAGTFAALFAHGQIQAADAQKVVAQQQELLTLVLAGLPHRRHTETEQVRDLARADRAGYRKHCLG